MPLTLLPAPRIQKAIYISAVPPFLSLLPIELLNKLWVNAAIHVSRVKNLSQISSG